jgi:hypothetical protein
MAEPIKYTDLYLYSTTNASSATFRSYLDSNLIKYTNLNYNDAESVAINVAALSTWFDDPANSGSTGDKIQFDGLPVLIFEKLFWESDDKSEKLQKRWYAKSVDELPSDFLTKVSKLES